MSSFGIESRGPFYQVGLIPIIPAQISTTAAGYGRASPRPHVEALFVLDPSSFCRLNSPFLLVTSTFAAYIPPKSDVM